MQSIFIRRVSLAGACAAALALSVQGSAQTVTAGARTEPLPSRCASYAVPPARVSDNDRATARDIASRAQAASIVGDNAQATALYQQAAKLNPSDASVAYALGREYEAAHDARSMGEYCRFLALTPRASEAADVRQRIAEIVAALPPDTTIVRVPVAVPVAAPARNSMPSGGGAFAAGVIVPGLGQFITRQPVGGLFVMAATAAAAVYGLQSQTVTTEVTETATDPFGNPYTFQTPETHTEHPHAAVGFGIAGGIWLIGAIQAAVHASSAHESAATADSHSAAAFPTLALAPGSVAVRFMFR